MRTLIAIFLSCSFLLLACSTTEKEASSKTAAKLLGNPNYTAICYGGFREKSRDLCPTIASIKEDMKILSALNIKLIRTYNTTLYPHAERTLQAIRELKEENPEFEMYVMLGAWIECQGAWTDKREHNKENKKGNEAEIEKAIELTKEYPEIVKIIAVGNESMVHWAETYFVTPDIVLKYVEELQQLKKEGELDSNLWITSSDNFASWGGGSADYHNEDLKKIIKKVDYVSMHTYPFHDTHYNPDFWQIDSSQLDKDKIELMEEAMKRARNYAVSQFESTKKFIHTISPGKPIHLGETGWSTSAVKQYHNEGSAAAGEFQQKLYYDQMRKWSEENNISCFFFEAFNEQWKDLTDEKASENHFGLFNLENEAKYVLWEEVDSGIFEGLTRGRKPVTKTYDGNKDYLLSLVKAPATKSTNE